MAFEEPTLDTDPDSVAVNIIQGLATRLPGWVAVEGAPEVALAEEFGRETAITNQLVKTRMELAVAGIGQTVFGFPVGLGVAATIVADITVRNVGDVVPAGFTVIGTTDAGVDVAFQLLAAVTAPTTTFSATLHAALEGTIGNDVPVGDLTIATSTASVVSVTATAVSSGGADDETLLTYLSRLVDYLSVLKPGGVRGDDLAALARSVPGVYRALGIDLYNALADQDNSERTATVYVVDENGDPVSAGVKADVYDALEAVREPNFLIFVEDPTYTAIDVVFTATADPGADPATVEADVITAIEAFLAPAAWGATTTDPEAWELRTVVRPLDVAAVAGAVPGVASLVTLTLNGSTGDVTLTGRAPLPAPLDAVDPTTVTGTVT